MTPARFAPAEAGAARTYAATPLRSDRKRSAAGLLRWTSAVIHVYWAWDNCNRIRITIATNGSGFSPTARLARIANPGSGAPRLKPGPAGAYAAAPLRSDRKRSAAEGRCTLRVCCPRLSFAHKSHSCNHSDQRERVGVRFCGGSLRAETKKAEPKFMSSASSAGKRT